jgi:hypothetical protein
MKLPLLAAALLVSACVAHRTTIQSTWADTEYAGRPLARVAVVAMFETRADSLAFERNAAEYLAAEGVETVPAHALLAPAETQRLDEDEVRARLAATDIDGVLIFRLLAFDERREYQVPTPYLLNGPPSSASGDPSSRSYEPRSSYYWYSGSPPDVANRADSPQGYWIEQTFLIAETALFDNRNDRLVWTGKSETLDDMHFERTSESIVRSVARRLFAMDLIARMAAPSDSAPRAERG